MLLATIPLLPPYCFDRLVNRLATHPDPQASLIIAEKKMYRLFRLQGQPVLIELLFCGDIEDPFIQLYCEDTISEQQKEELFAIVRHMFSADVDLRDFYQQVTGDSHLALLTRYFRGLRFLLDSDLFSSMVRTIIGQQVNLAFASTMTERLLALAGEQAMTPDGKTLWAFPTPSAIARLEVGQLREMQFSQRKAEYIIDFARAVVNEQIDLESIKKMTDDEVVAYLTPLRGIGRWSVECLLMFGLGRPDLLPAADIGLRNGIQLVYNIPDKLNEKQIRDIGEAWQPWRSYVSLYLWEAVGAVKRKEEKFIDLITNKERLLP
ncbi:DNA-3-methyladenine glycosylase family protein [Brevibacillus daliensis]|uniref:DNA-3-methyladenine glycosylase family protein n=1 Tax=Brevibacillus daliensis TaxID=2892995 RepID=UPI001E4C24A7|nr:DNA-3-methyladenine glycosylase [Brevibacillus daliensis]